MISITENKDIRNMTTFGLPAECGMLIEYDTLSDLEELRQRGLLKNALHIGGASNLLFTTSIFPGVVLHSNAKGIQFEHQPTSPFIDIRVNAGVTLDDLCDLCAKRNYWGLENLSGIPGEIGGATVQNVGAYGVEFKDLVTEVYCFDITSGEVLTLSNQDCEFGYRDSLFKHNTEAGNYIVLGATLRLSLYPNPRLNYKALADHFSMVKNDEITADAIRHAVIEMRNDKLPDPRQIGSAGSFFKNPVVTVERYNNIKKHCGLDIPAHFTNHGMAKLSAAWLIDRAGCKQFTHGGAAIWQKQPLVIINATGSAIGSDVVALENAICQQVKNIFDIDLVAEVIHI